MKIKNPSICLGDIIRKGGAEGGNERGGGEEGGVMNVWKEQAICLESGSQRHLQIAPRLGS